MKTFRYLMLFECLVIISIFLFFHDNRNNQYIFEFFKALFPRDSWVISTKYYQASKITSSLTSFFIVINTVFLILWGYLNYKKPTKDYNFYKFYEGNIKQLIIIVIIPSIFLCTLYLDPILLVPYKKNLSIPIDSLFSSIILNLLFLFFLTLMLSGFIVGITGISLRFIMKFI